MYMEFAKQKTLLFILIFSFSGILFLILIYNLLIVKQSLVYALEDDNITEIYKLLEYGNENVRHFISSHQQIGILGLLVRQKDTVIFINPILVWKEGL